MQHLVRPEGLSPLRAVYRSTMIARSARRAALIVSNSENNKGHIVELLGIHPDKVRVVPEGLDHDLFRPHPDPDRLRTELAAAGYPYRYLIYVSGLWPYKNVETLIEAFNSFVSHGFDHHLLIVGSGEASYRQRLSNLAAEGSASERIHFLGHASRQDVARLIQGAEVLVLPSLYESFGRVLTEAMACGTAVIAADTTALPEIVGDAGLLCSAQDPRAYEDAMMQLLTDESLRAGFVMRGLVRAAQYSWRKQAEMTVAVLEEAAA